ncbi:MAG TPA: hypothetical protein VNF99_06680 [Stellaceae bacterium]|nr:hypothetical protein [Stellaceae bacterium]
MTINPILAAGALSLLAVLAGCGQPPWAPLAAVTPDGYKPIAAASDNRIRCRHVAAHAADRGQVWATGAAAQHRYDYDIAYRHCLSAPGNRLAPAARAKNAAGSSSDATLPSGASLSPGNL